MNKYRRKFYVFWSFLSSAFGVFFRRPSWHERFFEDFWWKLNKEEVGKAMKFLARISKDA